MYADRLATLQAALAEHNTDAAALIPGANLFYMTGIDFHKMERPIIAVFHREGPPVMVLPRLEKDKFEAAAPFEAAIISYADGEDPAAAVREAIGALPEIQRLAVENLNMRVAELRLLQHRLPVSFVEDASPIMDALRLRKSPDEVALMRQAIHITEQALSEGIARLEEGITEREVAMRLSMAQAKLGGEHVPFPPIVLFGERAALPHGMPSDRALRPNEIVLIDFGTRSGGYASDLTRCFFFGDPDERTLAVYDAVLRGNEAAREMAGPGVACEDVDRAARAAIEEEGFGEYFIHRTGHGLGLEGHEGPYIVAGNQQTLEQGMTFTIEPGIYLPGELGVRIEDDMLVTEGGAESLTTYSRELRVLT